MVYQQSGPGGVELSDDAARLDVPSCIQWLAGSYWASDRTEEQIRRSFAGSRVFGVYRPDERQVALARAITDGASFCWLGDVYVAESDRGQGIGSWLVDSVISRLRAEGVPRFLLGTRDAHEVYARIGFQPLLVPEVYMELDERPTRPTRSNVDPRVLATRPGDGPRP